MISKTFSNLLIEIRNAAGLNQRAAAEKIGIRQPHLSSYEMGIYNIGLKNLARICKGYGLSPREELQLYIAAGYIHPKIEKYLLNNFNECWALMRKAGIKKK